MKLTAKIKLQPTPEQYATLLNTLETANAACNDISQQAWSSKIFRQFDLHRIVYHDIRERCGLSAQMTVRAIAKVTQAYKLDHRTRRTFALRGAFPYDDRILSFKTGEQTVSIWTIEGRQCMGYLCGPASATCLRATGARLTCAASTVISTCSLPVRSKPQSRKTLTGISGSIPA